MTTKFSNLPALLIAACLGSAGCERKLGEDADSEVVSACERYCRELVSSDHVYYDECMDVCVGADAESEAVGPACADAFDDMMACVGELDYAEVAGWHYSRTWGPSEKYEFSCEDQSVEFLNECPGVWYNE